MTTLDVEPFYTRTLCHGQRTEVWIAAALGGHPELIYTDDRLLLDACPFDDGTQP
jgi:ABC-type cobalamin/Fe3+-siderophores transport system ATPase subunit